MIRVKQTTGTLMKLPPKDRDYATHVLRTSERAEFEYYFCSPFAPRAGQGVNILTGINNYVGNLKGL
jgi:hypothetical protein